MIYLVTQTLTRAVEVEAEDEEEARDKGRTELEGVEYEEEYWAEEVGDE